LSTLGEEAGLSAHELIEFAMSASGS